MSRKYGWMDRAVAMTAALTMVAAGCGGAGGGDSDPVDEPGPGPGAAGFNGGSTGSTAVNIASEVAARRALANPLSPSAEVGTIPGEASVDATGSARYSMPIAAAPGPGGMQPEISISYDSSRGTGYAGLGFAIDGFGSTIERCEKTIADDGEADRIRLDDSDALCFGGRRMALISGVHGEVGAEYRPRRDPFEKIVLLDGDMGQANSRWEAWLGDGRIIEYSAKRHSQDPAEIPLKWYSDSIRDRYGNSLDYHWAVEPASVRPERITYGDGREIRFEFGDLPAVQVRSGYVAGRLWEKGHILDRVRVYGGGGAHLWDYDFSYDVVSGTQQQALESVERCDAAGACLPKTWFSWDQVWDGVGDVPVDPASPEFPPTPPPTDPFVLSSIDQPYFNSGFSLIEWGDDVDNAFEESLAAAWVAGAFHVMDLDGDGTDEVLVQDVDTEHFVLGPGGHIEGMPADGTEPSIIWVDLLDTVAFPDPDDTSLNSPSATSVALQDRSALEAFAADMIKCQNLSPCEPADWSFGEREQLHEEVALFLAPDEDDSLSLLTPLLSVSTDALPPGLGPMGMNLFGGSKDSLLFPISPEALGEPGGPVYTTWFVAAHEGVYESAANVGLSNYSFDPGGRVHSAIPVDHDGNGLSDLWMCRGDDPKHGRWALALNRGDDPPTWFVPGDGETSAVPENGGSLAFEVFDTGVRCSSLDDTLVVDMDGTSRSSLLVSPAFDPDSSSETVLSDAARTHYLQLQFELAQGAGSYTTSSLPWDRFQRWHDRACRNGPLGVLGGPTFGAGPGRDRQVDVNGDGLNDILRFSLSSGDGAANLGNIQDGLMSSWRYLDSCSASATHQGSEVRVYLNHGDGVFEAQADPLFTFNGNPHADFWLTWMNGWVVEVNADGVLDFGLPVDDGAVSESGGDTAGALFEVWLSRPNGTYVQGVPAYGFTWPNYTSDAAFRDQLARLGSVSWRPRDLPGQMQLVGNWQPDPDGYLPRRQNLKRKGRPLRLEAVSDGMGKWDVFEYLVEPRPDPDAVATLPAAKLTASQAVATAHRSQTAGGSIEESYTYSDPRIDLHTGQLLGFGEVTRTRAGVQVREEYTFAYDDAIRGFPQRGVPRVVERTIDLSPEGAPGTEQIVECAFTPSTEWDIRTPDAGLTWFSYPTRRESFLQTENSEPCDEASVNGWYDAFKVHEESRNDFGGVTWSEETRDGAVTTTTRTQPVDDTADWFVGRFGHEQVMSCQGSNCETRTQTLVYDTEHAELDASTLEPGVAPFQLTTEFIRDDGPAGHGGVVNRTRTDASGATRVERFGWDDRGIHLEWQSNPLGHISFFIHDNPTGVRVAVVEPNGNSMETGHDGFLRPVREQKRETPMGALAQSWTEIDYEAPGAMDAFAARTVTSAKPDGTGQVLVEEVGPTGKKTRSQWEGIVPLELAFAPPGSQVLAHNRVEEFYEYDPRGRLFRESNPTWVGTAPDAWTEWSYDNLDRPLEATLLDGGFSQLYQEERWAYDYGALGTGRVVLETYTDQDGTSTRRYFDGSDRIVEAYDGLGTPTAFIYGPFDSLMEVRRGGLYTHDALSITSYDYDRLGRRVEEVAPESGTATVSYTPFGEVEVVTVPEGTTAFVHDDLGRVTDRIDADGFHSWAFDTERLGALDGSTSADGVGRAFTYDAWGRTATETTTGPQAAFTLEFEYDASDRLEKVTYPEPGYSVFHEYDAFGYHRRTRSQRAPCAMGEAAIDWEWVSGDPAGNVTFERFGNGLSTSRGYQQGTYRPSSIASFAENGSTMQSLTYDWTDSGDLDMRTDGSAGESEIFTYDDAHRLRTWSWGGTTSETTYDVLGNITNKSGQGAYSYDAATDRLTQVGAQSYTYDDNGNVRSDGGRTLTWTAQNMVRSLQRDGQAWSLLYDTDGARVVREEAASNTATYNVGPTYELRFDGAELSEARISVLGATGRVVAEVFAERTALEENALWEHHKKFVHDDHLGSAHMISDREGTVEARVLYGPWGAARDGSDWNVPVSEADLDELPLGFTGHQPELDTGLINMRGRMYDPAVGRFMSVDPVIENALEVGTWNAYSYVLNRPLSLVDPTGLAAWQGTQADIGRHESFLAEQGFVGADYHNAEAYYAQIEFWKPWKAQTHGPRRESEVKKSAEGKTVQDVLCSAFGAGGCPLESRGSAPSENALADSSSGSRCTTWGRWCQLGTLGSEVWKNTEATQVTIDQWLVAMEIALMIADGAAIAVLARSLGKAGLKHLVKVLLRRACFAAGTEVATADGPQPIETIRPGDVVWAVDPASDDRRSLQRVVSTSVTPSRKVIALGVESDAGGRDVLRVTPDHPFWSDSDFTWVEAGDLQIGSRLRSFDGSVLLVVSVEGAGVEAVYSLEVEGVHTYYVGDVGGLVHNASCAEIAASNLRRLGLRGVRLYGRSYSAGIKSLGDAGFKLVEVTKTGRKVWQNSKTGATVYYDSGKALFKGQKPHWHVRDAGGSSYSRTGKLVESGTTAAHIPGG